MTGRARHANPASVTVGTMVGGPPRGAGPHTTTAVGVPVQTPGTLATWEAGVVSLMTEIGPRAADGRGGD